MRAPRRQVAQDRAGNAAASGNAVGVDERTPADRAEQDGRPHPGRLAGKSRAAAARRRRSKRRLLTWGSVAAVIAAMVASVVWLTQSPAPKSRYITTWQGGDLRTVPDACRVVSATMLKQYMAGTPTSIQPQNDQSQSQCTYTVDAKPIFRVLNITVQAFPPNLTVPGNGSATATATYNFAHQRQLLAKPPKGTPQPPAMLASVSGLGIQSLTAVQVFHLKANINRVTVLARYRNVLITVYLSGEAGDGFGPVIVTNLRAAAIAVTRSLLAQVKQEPAVG